MNHDTVKHSPDLGSLDQNDSRFSRRDWLNAAEIDRNAWLVEPTGRIGE